MNNEVFEKNNKYYKIKKDIYESREMYLMRVDFVLSRLKCDDDDFNENIKLSRIYSNSKNLKCKYSQDLMEKIK